MSKKQIVKFVQPKTSSRTEQLRFLAQLRGEIEEEKPKLNVKRFLLISAIVIAILAGGLLFTSAKINQINRHNEDVIAAQRLAQQNAEAGLAAAPDENAPTEAATITEAATVTEAAAVTQAATVTETATVTDAAAVAETATVTEAAAVTEAATMTEAASITEGAALTATERAAAGSTAAAEKTPESKRARTFEIIRIVFLMLLIACAIAFYAVMKRRPAEERTKKQVSTMCVILAVLLAGVVVFGILADSSEPKTAAVETAAADTGEETAEEGEGAAARTVDTSNQIDTSIATWNLVHFLLIVLLVCYGIFMLVKLAHPKRRKPNRSFWGDFGIYFMMAVFAVAMAFPLVFNIAASLKPLDELFRFPPKVFAQHPTLDNFSDLFVTMGQSYVPFSRYLTNTVLITFVGTFGHVIIASMAAFVLAKYDFPGGRTFFSIVVTALMFSGYVTGIPNYVIMSRLGFIDTYWAIILPAFAAPIGLFLMKQFMESLPTALIEAAHLDGAGEFRIFWSIVMPNVKPAWLTIIIFSVQSLWNNSASIVIYTEKNKTLVYALQQIQGGNVARTGQAAAVSVIVMIVPVLIFILSQSRILETMASSGLKD